MSTKDTTDKSVAAVLSASAPRYEWPVAPKAAASSALAVTLMKIENSSMQSFSVHAALVWTGANGANASVDIGTFAPYPANQAGTFMLRVPDEAKRLLTRKDGTARLRLSLEPITSDRALGEPLTVTIAEPSWR